MNKPLIIFIFICLIIAGSFGLYQVKMSNQLPQTEHAIHYPEPIEVSAFQFIDESANAFKNDALKGKWSFVFFGYTSCPDICPMTLQKLHFIYDDLIKIASNSQVLLVTVDPKRDTIEKLAQYIAYFNPNFKALRAEHDMLFPFSRSLGLMYAVTNTTNKPEEENAVYWVDHSASIALINPEGKLEAIFEAEQSDTGIAHVNSEKLLSDYQRIVTLYGQ